jgi:ABC-type phosphate transport system permease subunit
LEKEVAEADQKIAGLRPSTVMTSLDSADAKMSSLNLEQIIADVVSELMKDEAFQHIVQWLATLPGVIHGVYFCVTFLGIFKFFCPGRN